MWTPQERYDAHMRGVAANPNGWRKASTSRKRRYAQGARPGFLECLAARAEGRKPEPTEYHSTRGDRQRADWDKRKTGVTENVPLKYMHRARRERVLAEAVDKANTAMTIYVSPKRFNAQRNARSILGKPAAQDGVEFTTYKVEGGWSWKVAA